MSVKAIEASAVEAKQAHDDVIGAVYRAQADALEIEALAKRRLADEYDAAQERGEVQRHGGDRVSKVGEPNLAPTAADVGLSKFDIHEARQVRDAEVAEPGIVRRTLDDLIERGEEPTKALEALQEFERAEILWQRAMEAVERLETTGGQSESLQLEVLERDAARMFRDEALRCLQAATRR